MMSPKATKAATAANSHVSGGVAIYERGGACSIGAAATLRLCTGTLPQRPDGGGEAIAARFGRIEHVERSARR